MPFSIRDDETKDLADELKQLTSAKNRSAAIKAALKAQIKLAAKPITFQSRIEVLQNRAASLSGDGSAKGSKSGDGE